MKKIRRLQYLVPLNVVLLQKELYHSFPEQLKRTNGQQVRKLYNPSRLRIETMSSDDNEDQKDEAEEPTTLLKKGDRVTATVFGEDYVLGKDEVGEIIMEAGGETPYLVRGPTMDVKWYRRNELKVISGARRLTTRRERAQSLKRDAPTIIQQPRCARTPTVVSIQAPLSDDLEQQFILRKPRAVNSVDQLSRRQSVDLRSPSEEKRRASVVSIVDSPETRTISPDSKSSPAATDRRRSSIIKSPSERQTGGVSDMKSPSVAVDKRRSSSTVSIVKSLTDSQTEVMFSLKPPPVPGKQRSSSIASVKSLPESQTSDSKSPSVAVDKRRSSSIASVTLREKVEKNIQIENQISLSVRLATAKKKEDELHKAIADHRAALAEHRHELASKCRRLEDVEIELDKEYINPRKALAWRGEKQTLLTWLSNARKRESELDAALTLKEEELQLNAEEKKAWINHGKQLTKVSTKSSDTVTKLVDAKLGKAARRKVFEIEKHNKKCQEKMQSIASAIEAYRKELESTRDSSTKTTTTMMIKNLEEELIQTENQEKPELTADELRLWNDFAQSEETSNARMAKTREANARVLAAKRNYSKHISAIQSYKARERVLRPVIKTKKLFETHSEQHFQHAMKSLRYERRLTEYLLYKIELTSEVIVDTDDHITLLLAQEGINCHLLDLIKEQNCIEEEHSTNLSLAELDEEERVVSRNMKAVELLSSKENRQATDFTTFLQKVGVSAMRNRSQNSGTMAIPTAVAVPKNFLKKNKNKNNAVQPPKPDQPWRGTSATWVRSLKLSLVALFEFDQTIKSVPKEELSDSSGELFYSWTLQQGDTEVIRKETDLLVHQIMESWTFESLVPAMTLTAAVLCNLTTQKLSNRRSSKTSIPSWLLKHLVVVSMVSGSLCVSCCCVDSSSPHSSFGGMPTTQISRTNSSDGLNTQNIDISFSSDRILTGGTNSSVGELEIADCTPSHDASNDIQIAASPDKVLATDDKEDCRAISLSDILLQGPTRRLRRRVLAKHNISPSCPNSHQIRRVPGWWNDVSLNPKKVEKKYQFQSPDSSAVKQFEDPLGFRSGAASCVYTGQRKFSEPNSAPVPVRGLLSFPTNLIKDPSLRHLLRAHRKTQRRSSSTNSKPHKVKKKQSRIAAIIEKLLSNPQQKTNRIGTSKCRTTLLRHFDNYNSGGYIAD